MSRLILSLCNPELGRSSTNIRQNHWPFSLLLTHGNESLMRLGVFPIIQSQYAVVVKIRLIVANGLSRMAVMKHAILHGQ
jgi:hypothetical protein